MTGYQPFISAMWLILCKDRPSVFLEGILEFGLFEAIPYMFGWMIKLSRFGSEVLEAL